MEATIIRLVAVSILAVVLALQSTDARSTTVNESGIAVEGVTYALSGGTIQKLGRVQIDATILDGSNTRLSTASKPDGTFSFRCQSNQTPR